MAITSTPLGFPFGQAVPGGHWRRELATVTFDASYPTGGYAVTAATFGLSYFLAQVDCNPSSAAHIVLFNPSTSKIQVFTSQGTEVSNATDIHTVTCQVEAIGL